MSTVEQAVRRLLVDARPISHPTAGGRGVGNHVAGLLEGLAEGDTPVTALVGSERERTALDPAVTARIDVDVLGRPAIRRAVAPGTWYLATSLFLHPISLDPIPASVTEAGLPVRGAALRRDPVPVSGAVPHRRRPAPPGSAARRAQPDRRRVRHQLRVRQPHRRRCARPRPGTAPRDRLRGRGPLPIWRPRNPAVAGSFVPRRRPSVDRRHDHRRRRPQEHRGAASAWSRLPRATRTTRTLVVIAGASDDVLRRWTASAAELGITGEVRFAVDADDDQVVAMLQAAEFVVVPSLEEGFGLPAWRGRRAVRRWCARGCRRCRRSCPSRTPISTRTMRPTWRGSSTAPSRMPRCAAVLVSAAGDALERWSWRHVAHDVVATMAATSTGRGTRSPRRGYSVLAEDLAAAAPVAAEIHARAPDAEVTIGVDPVVPATGYRSSTARSWRHARSLRRAERSRWHRGGRRRQRCIDDAGLLAADHGAAVAARSDDPDTTERWMDALGLRHV